MRDCKTIAEFVLRNFYRACFNPTTTVYKIEGNVLTVTDGTGQAMEFHYTGAGASEGCVYCPALNRAYTIDGHEKIETRKK